MTRSVLIVDDESNMRWVLGRALEQAGYTVHGAGNGDEAAGLIFREPVDLVLLDLKLRGEDGLAVLRRLRERHPELVVIILTAYGTVPTAVEAMQLGAADFLRKPFDVEEVIIKVTRSLERRAMQQELARLTVARRSAPAFDMLIGAEPGWQRLVAQAREVAMIDDDVLLVGEEGSGRATLARAIHIASGRHTAPLIEVNLSIYSDAAQLAALLGSTTRGSAWAAAGSGSLLLRGLTEASTVHAPLTEHLAQRAAQTGPRLFVVTAEGSPIPETLQALCSVRLRVPPLRERQSDVLLLARHFAMDHPITPHAAQLLERHPWPGNISELRGVIERATQLAGNLPIDTAHLPTALHSPPEPVLYSPAYLPPDGVNLELVEQALIRQALERAHGNKSKAAELLGLSRHTLLYRMEKYGISAPERS
jgi:DNA-binding NtrC family response regulator